MGPKTRQGKPHQGGPHPVEGVGTKLPQEDRRSIGPRSEKDARRKSLASATTSNAQESDTSGQGTTEGAERRDGYFLLSSSGATELVKRLQLQSSALGDITKVLEQTSARLAKARAEK